MSGDRNENMGKTERIISGVLGGSLLVYSIAKRNKFSVIPAIGGAGLIYQSIRGHSKLYELLRVNRALPTSPSAVVGHEKGKKIEQKITIQRTPEELYAFWRNLTNLPQIMTHLESVEDRGNNVTHWTAKAPAGQTIEWDAEIFNEVPNELIAWRSLPDSDIQHAGSVQFRPFKNHRGTQVRVALNYHPPVGKIGAAVATLFGEEPDQQIKEDLQSFKALMENS